MWIRRARLSYNGSSASIIVLFMKRRFGVIFILTRELQQPSILQIYIIDSYFFFFSSLKTTLFHVYSSLIVKTILYKILISLYLLMTYVHSKFIFGKIIHWNSNQTERLLLSTESLFCIDNDFIIAYPRVAHISFRLKSSWKSVTLDLLTFEQLKERCQHLFIC